MGKTNKTNKYKDDDEEEIGYDPSEYRNRKKEKRISNVLKSKNIDELISLTDDDEEF
jgi:hypothetical protein